MNLLNYRHKRKAANKPEPPAGPALTREMAAAASDIHEPLSLFAGQRPNTDPLLSGQQPSAEYRWPYGLFEEALDKDAHLAAILAQRKAAVLAWRVGIEPAGEDAAATHCAALVEAALAGIGGGSGFASDLAELLDALAFGFAVSEVVWERRPAAALIAASQAVAPPLAASQHGDLLLPATLLSRHPRRFVFDADGAPRLITAVEPFAGEALPEMKFIVFAPYGKYENPYGYPLLRSIWWLAYFKRQVLRMWVSYAEKHGTPTAVLRYPPGATDKEKRSYKRIIASIQQETGLVVPEGVELSLLEAQRSGSVQTYSELIELCNREMSKALLGQTLTTEPGERGARSLGEVHHMVRADIVRQDSQALASALNHSLVHWIVDLNVPGGQRSYPRLVIEAPDEQDLTLQLAIDRFFAEQGLPLDEAELYARYRRARPQQ